MTAPTFEHSSSISAVPTTPAMLMSFAARQRPSSASPAAGEVGAQAVARRPGRSVPVGMRIAETPAQVDGGDEIVARCRIEAREQPGTGAAEHGDRQVPGLRTRVRVAADDRHAVERGGVRHAGQDRVRRRGVPAPQGVDDRERAPAHGRHVAEVDHDPAIAGEVGIGRDEAVDEALDGEEQVSIPIGNGGAVVAHRHRGMPGTQSEPRDDGIDVTLVGDAARIPDLAGQGLEVDGRGHHAACGT